MLGYTRIKVKKAYTKIVIWIQILAFLGMMIFLLFENTLFINNLGNIPFTNKTENIRLAEGFTIPAYEVILDVKEDNKVFVTENITVDFLSDKKHGIYRYLPEWLEYTGKNNKTIKRKSNILNLKAVDDISTLGFINNKFVFKIGNPYEYVEPGEKTYKIQYIYDMGEDPFKKFDEFIFHAYGDYWGTEIKNASLQIRMPKSLSGSKISFFADKYRRNDVTKYVDYYISGNTIHAKFNSEKYRDYIIKGNTDFTNNNISNDLSDFISSDFEGKLTKALSVHIELPEGYFVGGSWNYGVKSLIASIIVFILTFLTVIRWYKYGRNYPKLSKTIEFYPPENYSSAEIGYIYSRQMNPKLTISLIISLASKGYIRIDELKDKKGKTQITKLLIKPKQKEDFEAYLEPRQITVKKLKESDLKLSQSENSMMEYLFTEKNVETLNTNIDEFLKVKDNLLNYGYLEILDDNEESRRKELKEKKLEHEKKIEEYNKRISELSIYEEIVFSKLFEYKGDIVILSEHSTFYEAFEKVEDALQKEFKDLIIDKKATFKMKFSIFITIVVLVLSLLSFFVFADLDPGSSIMYKLSFVCIFINSFFTMLMKRKTESGEEMIARVNGYRDFLLKVEKTKLEELVEEDPDYFYNILPYTYVLNISRKWISKFENIQFPKRSMGDYNLYNSEDMGDIYNNISFPEKVTSPEKTASTDEKK